MIQKDSSEVSECLLAPILIRLPQSPVLNIHMVLGLSHTRAKALGTPFRLPCELLPSAGRTACGYCLHHRQRQNNGPLTWLIVISAKHQVGFLESLNQGDPQLSRNIFYISGPDFTICIREGKTFKSSCSFN